MLSSLQFPSSEYFEYFRKRLQDSFAMKGTPHNMELANASAEAFRKQIQQIEGQLARLKAQLAEVEAATVTQKTIELSQKERTDPVTLKWPLLPEEYKRYGRQMIVPSIGIQGIPNLFTFVLSSRDIIHRFMI